MLKRGDEAEEENKQNGPRSRVQNKEASYIIKLLSAFIPSEDRTAGNKKSPAMNHEAAKNMPTNSERMTPESNGQKAQINERAAFLSPFKGRLLTLLKVKLALTSNIYLVFSI
jgi:hypothetical protein